MGLLDKVFDNNEDKKKNAGRADFSDVRGGSSSTAPDAEVSGATSSELGAGRTYTIRAGDSLRKIAQRIYGDEMQWHKIYDANRGSIRNPDLIHEGHTLVIPD